MRYDHLVLLARARWRVAFVLLLLAAALSVWLMSASNEPRPFYCGNAPVVVDSVVVERRARRESQRRAAMEARFGTGVDPERGLKIFKMECAACHKLDKDLTGPALNGALDRAPQPGIVWLRAFLTAQDSLLRAKDPYATALQATWGNNPWRHEYARLTPAQFKDLMAWVEVQKLDPLLPY
jgi:mono/diheme cytochrome c family protein